MWIYGRRRDVNPSVSYADSSPNPGSQDLPKIMRARRWLTWDEQNVEHTCGILGGYVYG